MAVLTCDICGGKLVMGTGGVAVCDSCGMEHSKDRMQEKVQEIKGTVTVSNIADVESLMKRGHLALEDSEWSKANEYFDKVLDIDPENARGYLGKLCAETERRSEHANLVDRLPLYPKRRMTARQIFSTARTIFGGKMTSTRQHKPTKTYLTRTVPMPRHTGALYYRGMVLNTWKTRPRTSECLLAIVFNANRSFLTRIIRLS